ncbi:MAG: hypothetical protein NTV54_15120 [Ignavibacteriales bacterium]|nr:hypothetical protein [Ignavibacteriales bacterium]
MNHTMISEEELQDLQNRIHDLEEMERWTREALEMIVSFVDTLTNIGPTQTQSSILTSTRLHLDRIMGFRTLAFLIVDDADADIAIADAAPDVDRILLQKEIDECIADGTIAWTISQNRAVIIPSRQTGNNWIIQALWTRSRVVGVFIGELINESLVTTESSLHLLSIVLFATANAIENALLTHQLSEQNKELEQLMSSLTSELAQVLQKTSLRTQRPE